MIFLNSIFVINIIKVKFIITAKKVLEKLWYISNIGENQGVKQQVGEDVLNNW